MLEENIPALAEINTQCEKQQYGSISVTFDIFQGRIVGMQGSQFQKIKLCKEENAKATALIISEIKNLHEMKSYGMFTFSVKMADGDIKELYIQRNLKKNYPLRKKNML
jgi:hypothetical protein